MMKFNYTFDGLDYDYEVTEEEIAYEIADEHRKSLKEKGVSVRDAQKTILVLMDNGIIDIYEKELKSWLKETFREQVYDEYLEQRYE